MLRAMYDGSLCDVEFQGSGEDLLISVAAIINTLHQKYYDEDPGTAYAFKRLLQALIASDDGGVWKTRDQMLHEGIVSVTIKMP